MIECIILAGGFGTRLKSVVSDRPKPLAEVNKVPFLDLLLHRLASEKDVFKVILAIGYMREMIAEQYQTHPFSFRLEFSMEEQPMGTGGAIKKALEMTSSSSVLVMNGDSYVEFDFKSFQDFHFQKSADLTLVCRKMDDASRYGILRLNEERRIVAFEEKSEEPREGIINGGVYWMKRSFFEAFSFDQKFSLETEIAAHLFKKKIFGYPCQGLFIDIGTPESFLEAQTLLKPLTLEKS